MRAGSIGPNGEKILRQKQEHPEHHHDAHDPKPLSLAGRGLAERGLTECQLGGFGLIGRRGLGHGYTGYASGLRHRRRPSRRRPSLWLMKKIKSYQEDQTSGRVVVRHLRAGSVQHFSTRRPPAASNPAFDFKPCTRCDSALQTPVQTHRHCENGLSRPRHAFASGHAQPCQRQSGQSHRSG